MKERSISLLVIIALLLMLPLSYGFSIFVAGSNDFLSTVGGNFNTGLSPIDDVVYTVATVSDVKSIPVVDDLNGDGLKEVYFVDGDSLVVYTYNGISWTLVDFYDFGDFQEVSNLLAFDIDGDSTKEIIFATETAQRMEIVDFNGSTLTNTTYTWGNNASGILPQTMIQCRAANDCLMFYTYDVASSGSTGKAFVRHFTSSSSSNELQLLSGITGGVCTPKIKHIELADVDNDGSSEYVTTYINHNYAGAGAARYYMQAIDVTATVPTSQWVTIASHSSLDIGTANNCTDTGVTNGAGRLVSPPICFDMTTSPTGIECAFAKQIDTDEFNVRVVNKDGSTITPLGWSAEDGEYPSNPVRAQGIDSDSSATSFCVAGFESTAMSRTEISCYNKQSEKQRTYDVATGANQTFAVSPDANRFNTLMTGVEMSEQTSSGDGSDGKTEFVTTYGVFRLEQACGGVSDFFSGGCDIELIYQNQYDDSLTFPIDYQSVGSSDLMTIDYTGNNLVYQDDNLEVQAPARIIDVTYNPCFLDSAVKQNTTQAINVKVTDGNTGNLPLDPVSVKVTFYANSPHNRSQIVTNQTVSATGTTIPFTFTPNVTGVFPDGIIIEAFDTGVPTQIATVKKRYTVASNGLVFGESVCTETVTVTTTGATGVNGTASPLGVTNAAPGQLLDQFETDTGYPKLVLWLLFHLVGSIMIASGATLLGFSPTSSGTAFGISLATVNILLFILGVAFGVYSAAILVGIGVLILVPISFFLYIKVTSGTHV